MNQLQPKFNTGLVIGKFYPPHRGHKFLINTALAQCKSVTVILCYKRTETISGFLRAEWLKRIHPSLNVIVIDDYLLEDDDSEGWAKFTIETLGYVPDAVFTSEDYGDPYAKFMGSTHVLVDKLRVNIPISATQIRSNPLGYFNYLEPVVKSFYAKRICIIGAESTGTTTLSQDLAKHYKTVWVPEYGRVYSEGKLYTENSSNWYEHEFANIAQAQNVLENSLAEQSSGLVICDTNAYATAIWHERYLQSRSEFVEQHSTNNNHVLYIVTKDDIPFIQDGVRDGEHLRHWMHERIIERLEEDHKKYIVVSGTREQRLNQAILAINRTATVNW